MCFQAALLKLTCIGITMNRRRESSLPCFWIWQSSFHKYFMYFPPPFYPTSVLHHSLFYWPSAFLKDTPTKMKQFTPLQVARAPSSFITNLQMDIILGFMSHFLYIIFVYAHLFHFSPHLPPHSIHIIMVSQARLILSPKDCSILYEE